MAVEFAAAVAEIEKAGTRIAILEAEGPAFCAGVDLKDLHRGGDALYSMLDTLLGTPIYWLAVVRGAVRGAGLSLLAACPRVLSIPNSSFGLPELSRGFFPNSVVDGLAKVIGARHAYELAFQAEPIDAREATRIGLVSAVFPEPELRERVDSEVAKLASLDAEALMVGVTRWQASARVLIESEALRAQ
jgi:methylglutaconyl-CoA hydratase